MKTLKENELVFSCLLVFFMRRDFAVRFCSFRYLYAGIYCAMPFYYTNGKNRLLDKLFSKAVYLDLGFLAWEYPGYLSASIIMEMLQFLYNFNYFCHDRSNGSLSCDQWLLLNKFYGRKNKS